MSPPQYTALVKRRRERKATKKKKRKREKKRRRFADQVLVSNPAASRTKGKGEGESRRKKKKGEKKKRERTGDVPLPGLCCRAHVPTTPWTGERNPTKKRKKKKVGTGLRFYHHPSAQSCPGPKRGGEKRADKKKKEKKREWDRGPGVMALFVLSRSDRIDQGERRERRFGRKKKGR